MQAIARRAAPAIYALAMFSSAALIFVLQPLFAHIVTPLLGGSPSVWNVSMAFFQAALLAGYLYAHLLARLKDLRLQAAIHAIVLIGAWMVLPIRVSDALGPPSSTMPALWLVGVLTLSVGAPFAAMSATAPLLQSWYARSGRADAHDPYYLYAASNLGSFIGLLAYPALIEPLLGVRAQSADWAAGFVLAGAMIALAAATVIAANDANAGPEHAPAGVAPDWRKRGFWVAAAAIPSALILGVTLHITTDVASAPLLWVVPLALYLATFVIAFSRGSERLSPYAEFVFPVALFLLVASYFSRANWLATLSGNLVGFFISALLCHLALSRSRPRADRLTEFYFFVSLGGVLGGAFAAFVAPVIFNDVYEYPLALAAAALFLRRGHTAMPRLADAAIAAAVFMAIVAVLFHFVESDQAAIVAGTIGAAGAVVAAGWGEENRPPPFRYGFMIAAAALALIAIVLLFNLGTAIQHYTEDDVQKIRVVGPWPWLLTIAGFMVLLFAAHASMQPRQLHYADEDAEAAGEHLKPDAWAAIADYALGAAIPGAILLIGIVFMNERLDAQAIATLGIVLAAVGLFLNRTRPQVLAGLVIVSFAIIFINDVGVQRTIHQERSFFGVLRVRELSVPANPGPIPLRVLMHGTTLHGAQLQGGGLSQLPLTYYNPSTSLGEAILAGLNAGEHSRLALIGLGTGTTSCLMRRSDQLDIFEIDPAIVRLSASPQSFFTYVRECQPNARVHLGDARLQMAREPDNTYDVIVVDAFSSDAIPAHLLTREAVAMYLRKTTARGIVVLHLSNRNLALVSEAVRVAHSLDAPSLFLASENINDPRAPFYGGLAASTVIVARSPVALAHLPLLSTNWRVIRAPPGKPWSDDYINISRALWENLDGSEICRSFPDAPRCEGKR